MDVKQRQRSSGIRLFSKKEKAKAEHTKVNRSQSLPARLKSNMRVSTLDESLHKTYYEKSQSFTEGPTARERTIEFDKVLIREYERVVGDNPSCSSGVPVSIGWAYYPDQVVMELDAYENTRPPRRSSTQMLLPRSVREDMLKKEWGVPQSQIASAVRTNIKVKNQRRRTVTNLNDKTEKMELAMENVGRKLKKSLSFGSKKELKELQVQ